MTTTAKTLKLFGFDRSYQPTPGRGAYRVACSQCEALVVNGVPTHESGCPRAVHECRGCNNLVPMRQQYCSDCN
jgi:hypothetical protein